MCDVFSRADMTSLFSGLIKAQCLYGGLVP